MTDEPQGDAALYGLCAAGHPRAARQATMTGGHTVEAESGMYCPTCERDNTYGLVALHNLIDGDDLDAYIRGRVTGHFEPGFDRHGNLAEISFVRGPDEKDNQSATPTSPTTSARRAGTTRPIGRVPRSTRSPKRWE